MITYAVLEIKLFLREGQRDCGENHKHPQDIRFPGFEMGTWLNTKKEKALRHGNIPLGDK
jgi:hypothetical protein